MKLARPIVGVDIDGVLGNQVQGVLDRVNSRDGESFEYDGIVEWDMQLGSTSFKVEIEKAMKDSNYVLGMPVHEGAAEMLAALRDHWTVKILTVRPEKAMEWTQEWLDKNDLLHDELIQTREGRKSEHGCDVLIDDLPENLAELLDSKPNGCAILVDQPWNRAGPILNPLERWREDPRLTRVFRLADIPAVLARC
jgi:5'(3')-deoxyribonucleotidase